MAIRRTVIILANSSKHGGRCIAGKDIVSGEWIRFGISGRDDPVMFSERDLLDYSGQKTGPDVLDLYEVTWDRPEPKCHHPEDCILADVKWKFAGHLSEDVLFTFEDRSPSELLQRCTGHNDTIAVDDLKSKPIGSSLHLMRILPDYQMRIYYAQQPESRWLKPRLEFALGSRDYDLSITDPRFPRVNDRQPEKRIDQGYVALGLTDPFKDGSGFERYHYKIALTLFI